MENGMRKGWRTSLLAAIRFVGTKGYDCAERWRTGLLAVMIFAVGLQMAGCSTSSERSINSQTTTTVFESTTGEKNDLDAKLAAEHLRLVWFDYLTVLDQMYASELWALDYVEDYLESGDWGDLTKARTACIASARYLSELSRTNLMTNSTTNLMADSETDSVTDSITEKDLSKEEYLSLSNAGVDTGYQSVTFSSLADTLDGTHSFVRDRLLENLESQIFYKSIIDILKEEISIERDAIFFMSQYHCVETNYMLFSLRELIDSDLDEDWSAMQEKYPVLSAGCGEWLDTEAELKIAGDGYLDQYEEIILKQAEVLSAMHADLYDMTQIVRNQDLETLAESAYPMTNLPDLLPMPVWYDPEKTGYLSFIREEEEKISYPESGDELLDADYGMYLQIREVSEEEIEEYLAFAECFAGLIWKEEEGAAWYISMPEYSVKIEWEDDLATLLFIGEDITFAPSWYIGR